MNKLEELRGRGYSELDDCIYYLRLINMNPFDKKLLKQEMYERFSDYTIALARKIIREEN
jgi:hypothetical protein